MEQLDAQLDLHARREVDDLRLTRQDEAKRHEPPTPTVAGVAGGVAATQRPPLRATKWLPPPLELILFGGIVAASYVNVISILIS